MVQMDEAARLTSRMAVPKKSLGLLELQIQKLMRAWKTIQFDLRPFH